MKLIKFFVMIVTLFSSLFCYAATKTEKQIVELKYEAKSNKPEKQKSTQKKSTQTGKKKTTAPAPQYNCKVDVESFLDLRANQQTLGATFNKPLISNDVSNWLETIRNDELIAKTKNWVGTKNLILKPQLKKLYSYAESMNIHGVVSMEIEFWIDGKQVKSIYYRGMGSKMNAWNALYEYGIALNYGVHEIAPKILADIKSTCAP